MFHVETGLRTEYVVSAVVVVIDSEVGFDAVWSEVTTDVTSFVEGTLVVEVELSLSDWTVESAVLLVAVDLAVA
jgi:hypothetical protein